MRVRTDGMDRTEQMTYEGDDVGRARGVRGRWVV
jgi:hypothetical protein